jgi:hypothetical protein
MSTNKHKYPLDIIKSGCHKYLRRNNKDMFIRCMLEFYLYCQEQNDFSPLIIRIQIMSAEEILFVNYTAIITIYQKLKEFRLSSDNYFLIIDCCNLLISSRRTRLVKYLMGYYSLGIDYKFAKLVEIKYDPLIAPLKKEKDSDPLVEVVNKFYTQFKNFDNYDSFYYALKTFYKFKTANLRFGKKRKPMYWIWEILLYEVNLLQNFKYQKQLKEYVNIMLEYFHYPCNYKPMFLIQALLAYLHRDKLDYEENKKESKKSKKEDYKKIMERHKRIKFTIDPFCIDVHTKIGRNNGKTKFDFYDEGRIVIDEDLEYVNNEYVKVYDLALKKYHKLKALIFLMKRDKIKNAKM